MRFPPYIQKHTHNICTSSLSIYRSNQVLPCCPSALCADLPVNSNLKTFCSGTDSERERVESKIKRWILQKTQSSEGVKKSLNQIVLILLATEHTVTLDVPLVTLRGCLLEYMAA